jgi:hypothetical protein
MTVSQMRLSKSETRDMADRMRMAEFRFSSHHDDWTISNNKFFIAFVVIAAAFTLALLLSGCGGASLQTIQLSNQTERTIKELYVFPAGSKDKGKSRGTVAPNGGITVQMPAGNVEVYAISETVKIDDHTRDTPTASQGLELTGPLKVIFYDGSDRPAAVNNPGVIGVSFIVSDKKPADSAPAP